MLNKRQKLLLLFKSNLTSDASDNFSVSELADGTNFSIQLRETVNHGWIELPTEVQPCVDKDGVMQFKVRSKLLDAWNSLFGVFNPEGYNRALTFSTGRLLYRDTNDLNFTTDNNLFPAVINEIWHVGFSRTQSDGVMVIENMKDGGSDSQVANGSRIKFLGKNGNNEADMDYINAMIDGEMFTMTEGEGVYTYGTMGTVLELKFQDGFSPPPWASESGIGALLEWKDTAVEIDYYNLYKNDVFVCSIIKGIEQYKDYNVESGEALEYTLKSVKDGTESDYIEIGKNNGIITLS